MNQTHKLLSLLLALLLCLGLLPMTALADEELTDIRIITDNKGQNGSQKDDLTYIGIITDNKGSNSGSSGGDSSAAAPVFGTITFNANGGKFSDGSTTKSVKCTAEGTPFSEVPTRDGYDFQGWQTREGAPVWSPEEVAERASENNATLKAVWKEAEMKDSVTITDDPGGKKNEGDSGPSKGSEVIYPGDEAEKPKGPFRITFNANGGKFSNGKSQVVLTTTTGDDGYQVCGANIPGDPTREGYAFNGWDNATLPQSSFSSVGRKTDANYFASFHIKQNFELRAVWEAKTPYTITLDANGGKFADGSATKKITTHWNFSYCLPDDESQMPTWAGHTFVGWEYKGSISTSYHDKYDEDRTYKAVWDNASPSASKGFRVDFDPDGGTIKSIKGFAAADIFPASSLAQDNGVFVDKNSGRGMMTTDGTGKLGSLPVIERAGYTFDGWYQDGTKVTESTVFKAEAQLKAKWTKADENSCTVTFSLNGYTGVALPSPITVKKGETIKDLPKLEIPGEKAFPGWGYANADGKTLTEWKTTDKVTGDLTLYVIRYAENSKTPTVKTPLTTAKPSTPAASGKPAFTDVPASSPFAKAIAWAVEKGITNGTSPTTFAPGTTCSTGHILTFLWRANGSPEPTIENPYNDEIPNAFKKAAIWAHEKGLVSGDTFGSAVPCTRAASVTYMWKLAGSPEAKAASFKDVTATSGYAKAISWAVEQGVTKGTGDGTTFSPENICTRGQIVTFLNRAYAD